MELIVAVAFISTDTFALIINAMNPFMFIDITKYVLIISATIR